MNSQKFHTIQKILKKNTFLPYFIIFEVAFIVFYFLQNQLTFADPDSFYHVKMAILMKEQGIIRDFPWLQFTVLKNYYTDHHLLYHIALIPFISILPPLVGAKLATIIFSSSAITVFYWLLRRLEVRGAWFYAFVLMVSASFIFRINLAKAQSLALIAFFIGYYLIEQKKIYSLAIFSFIYVWLYGGWPLIFVVFGVYFLTGLLFQFKSFKKNLAGRIREFFYGTHYYFDTKGMFQWIQSQHKSLAAVCVGIVAGLVINPYFPKNLFFYWYQIIHVAVINYKGKIGVGGEWYGYNPIELISSSSLAFIVAIVACTFFILAIGRQTIRSASLMFLTVTFFILTIKSRRNVEYLIPTMLLFSGVSLTIFADTVNIKNFYRELKSFFMEQKILFIAALIPLFLIPYVIGRDYMVVRGIYGDGQKFDKYKGALEWLESHSPKNSIVFHSDWDEFPILFYHNTHNYYIVGLDPTFMYDYDQNLYRKWKDVTTGQEKSNIYSIIKNDFRSEFVFVSLDRHESFDNNLKDNFLFEKVYQEGKLKIYKVL